MAAQAFRASRRASALRLRVFYESPPALERRLTAFPKAQNKASIAHDEQLEQGFVAREMGFTGHFAQQ